MDTARRSDFQSLEVVVLSNLISLIEAFVAPGGDRSIEAANRIETALDELMGNDERFCDYVTDLASYRPLGGPYLVTEEEMVTTLKRLLTELRT